MVPEDGEWLSFRFPDIEIHFSDSTLELVPSESSLWLDGESLRFHWDGSAGTIRSSLLAPLLEGLHHVGANLTFVGSPDLDLAWTFGIDTTVPELVVEPLPEVWEEIGIDVRGSVSDANLLKVTVGTLAVPVQGGRFSTLLGLWPGHNDIVVEASDLAGNVARRIQVVGFPIEAPAPTLETWIHENASFSIDLPGSWEVVQDFILPTGSRAEIAAASSPGRGLPASVIVVSQSSALAYPKERAVEWMNLLISGVQVSNQLLKVVARTHFVDTYPRANAVQSTLLRLEGSRVAFTQITMIWSGLLERQWVIIASVDSQEAHATWPLLEAATLSFRPLDEGLGDPGEQGPDVLLPMLLVTAASVFLASALVTVLLENRLARWRERRREQWRPPSNWGRL